MTDLGQKSPPIIFSSPPIHEHCSKEAYCPHPSFDIGVSDTIRRQCRSKPRKHTTASRSFVLALTGQDRSASGLLGAKQGHPIRSADKTLRSRAAMISPQVFVHARWQHPHAPSDQRDQRTLQGAAQRRIGPPLRQMGRLYRSICNSYLISSQMPSTTRPRLLYRQPVGFEPTKSWTTSMRGMDRADKGQGHRLLLARRPFQAKPRPNPSPR